MRILFFSDIHGITTNLPTLKKVIDNNDFNKIVVLGDLYDHSFYKKDKDVDNEYIKKFLNSYKDKLIVLRGNCDSNSDINFSDFEIIDDVSMMSVDGITIYLTHGNRYRYLYNDTFCRGILIYGHEHIPYIKKELDMVYINTGSISLPRNHVGATYTIYENRSFTIYNLENKVVEKITVSI